MNKCKNCGKEIAENLDFCSKECMETYQKTTSIDNSEIENDLLDPSFMKGIFWRKTKLEAIHQARLKGYSENAILHLLMRGGLTRSTAKKLMDDSKLVYEG